MPKLTSLYVCQQCNYQSPTFLGRCPECGSWNSLVEQVSSNSSRGSNKVKSSITTSEVINLNDIKTNEYDRINSTLSEFDRVLGGGLVKGSIVLISGDPGIGKSTLLTQLALGIQSAEFRVQNKEKETLNSQLLTHNSVLYVAGEESAQQIKLRVDRLKIGANLAVLNEIDVDVITGVIEQMKPSLVIIDSIQTMETQDLESVAGSVGQVRECSHRLQRTAKSLHIPILLVGHVTKEGTVAGPRTLEHLVDVVLSLEGEPSSSFRILRASKNRFGPTDEVGIFEMEGAGLVEVKNPSKIFLENKVDAPGSVVVASLNGYRPILVEIQALVTKSFLPSPRRNGSGVDLNRLQLLVAVLQKRLGLPLFDQDVFVNVTGGLKVLEPAVDLGIVMSIISSLKDKKVKSGVVLVGEVGLLGELRAVRQLDKRTNEAKKLGFTSVIAPPKVSSLAEAVSLALEKS